MTEGERIRVIYQHCCLKYVNKEIMTNTTLRERFRIDKNNSSTVSRLISLPIEKNMIKDFDPDGSTKNSRNIFHIGHKFYLIMNSEKNKKLKILKILNYFI